MTFKYQLEYCFLINPHRVVFPQLEILYLLAGSLKNSSLFLCHVNVLFA